MANIILHKQISNLFITMQISEKRLLNGIYSERGQMKKSEKKSTEKSKLAYKPESKSTGDKFVWTDNDKNVWEGGSKGSSIGLKFWYWTQLKGAELDFCPDAALEIPPCFVAWVEKFKMTAEEIEEAKKKL